MKYLIVSASSRAQSQSIRIASWIEHELQTTDDETVLLDLHQVWLPEDPSLLWADERGDTTAKQKFQPTKHFLDWCDGVIVICPEWDGMLPGKIITFFQCVQKSLAYKPGLIITNSDRRGGAYPEVILRGFSSKNTRIMWLPEHLIVRHNERMFMDDPRDTDDVYIQKRARFCLDLLRRATAVWAPERQPFVDSLKQFNSGM